MEKQFTTPVSMKVPSEEAFKNDLETPLKEMGYNKRELGSFKVLNYLCTNFAGSPKNYSNLDESSKNVYNRYFIEPYNPKLFLALAGMTNSPDGNVGEWWKCVDNGTSERFTKGNLYKQFESSTSSTWFILDNLQKGNGFFERNKDHFIKATKEEIIAFFSETETEVEQELIGYRFRNEEFNKMACVISGTPDMYTPSKEQGHHIYRTWYIVDQLKDRNLLETFCEPVYAQRETPISYEEAIEKLNENSKVKYTKVK